MGRPNVLLWVKPNIGLSGYGGAEEDRTPDLRIANAALSQLSYGPTETPNIVQIDDRAASVVSALEWPNE